MRPLQKVLLCRREVSCCPPPPLSAADSCAVTDALSVLAAAQRPLIIIGKGDKLQNLSQNVKALVEFLNSTKSKLRFNFVGQQEPLTHKQKAAWGSLWRWADSHSCPPPWGRGSFLMTIQTAWLLPAHGRCHCHNVNAAVRNLLKQSKIKFTFTFTPVYINQGSSSGWCHSADRSSAKLDSTFWSAPEIWPECQNHPGTVCLMDRSHMMMIINMMIWDWYYTLRREFTVTSLRWLPCCCPQHAGRSLCRGDGKQCEACRRSAGRHRCCCRPGQHTLTHNGN